MLTYNKFMEDIEIDDKFPEVLITSVFNRQKNGSVPIRWMLSSKKEKVSPVKTVENTIFHFSRKLLTRVCFEQILLDMQPELADQMDKSSRKGYSLLNQQLSHRPVFLIFPDDLADTVVGDGEFEAQFVFRKKSTQAIYPQPKFWKNPNLFLFDIMVGDY